MKTAVCAIGRLENQYAVEFVEHYTSLGFDKVIIYDNNHDEEECFEDVLQPCIENGCVEIVPFRNVVSSQLLAYNDCYAKYGNDYDWIAFFDFDEYLVLKKDKDIKEFLSKFNDYDVIKINWMMYNDNNLITNDGRPLNERFTTPCDFEMRHIYSFPTNNHTKSIIRGGIQNFSWCGNPHVPGMNLRYCDAEGDKSDSSAFQPYCFETAYLKHFSTKTIEEFIKNKCVRGVADRNMYSFKQYYSLNDHFFKINERTKEKEKYVEELWKTKENQT